MRGRAGGGVAVAAPAVAFEPGERVWLDVRGRFVPAVVTGWRAGRVRLRVQRSDRWDAVRIVRGRAKPGALSRRESVHEVDRISWRSP
jgi:hypothetical protein